MPRSLVDGHTSFGLEGLESRTMLAASALPFVAYFPEGYSNDRIKEFVPITNPNDQAVDFELHARYEVGERDFLIESGSIPAKTRGGVTICDSDIPSATKVRKDVPYALVLRSSMPVSATLSHYDFNVAIGESFTTTTSREWSFGDGMKSNASSRDYLLFYNPSDTPVDVTVTLFGTSGQQSVTTLRVDGQRRSGLSVNDITTQPEGVFATRISASGPVVAAQSHYEPNSGRGYGVMGTPGGGTTSGVVPAIDYDDRYEFEGLEDELSTEEDDLSQRAFDLIDQYIAFSGEYLDARNTTFEEWFGVSEDELFDELASMVPGFGYEYGDEDASLDDVLAQMRMYIDNLDERWDAERRDYFDNHRGFESWDARFNRLDRDITQLLSDYRGWADDFESKQMYFEMDFEDNSGQSSIAILNANDQEATVTFSIVYDDSHEPFEVTRTVPPKSRTSISVRDLDLPFDDDEFGITYRSDLPVTVTSAVEQGPDGTGVNGSPVAATVWDFGEGFMSRSRAGTTVTEDIFIYNPGSSPATVTIDVLFWDGRASIRLTQMIAAGGMHDAKLHEWAELRDGDESKWYGLRLTSSVPVVAMLEHWDEDIGGGFSTLGMPSGTLVPVDGGIGE